MSPSDEDTPLQGRTRGEPCRHWPRLRGLTGSWAYGFAIVTLSALCLGVAVHRSQWIGGYLERLGSDRIAAGPNGLGRDYATNVWIPTHALAADVDPYDPNDATARTRYHADIPSAPYTPSILLFLLPLSALPLPRAVEAMSFVNVLLLWLSLLVLLPPRDVRSCALVAALGLATIEGYAAESALLYGQPIGLFALGFALLARALALDGGTALAVAGTMLLLTKAQFGVPALVLLAALGRMRVVVLAVAGTALASLPFGILFVRAAGGVVEAMSVLHRVVVFTERSFPLNRTDVVTLMGARGSPPGTTAIIAELIVICALAAILLRRQSHPFSPLPVVALITAAVLAATYHQWYDLTVLVIPAAIAAADPKRAWRDAPLVVSASAVFVLLNLATRESMRARLAGVDGGRILSALDQYWPPAITLLVLCAATASLLAGRGRTTAEQRA